MHEVEAEYDLGNGHMRKVLDDGTPVTCTTCLTLRERFQQILEDRPDLMARHEQIVAGLEAEPESTSWNEECNRLEAELVEIQNGGETTGSYPSADIDIPSPEPHSSVAPSVVRHDIASDILQGKINITRRVRLGEKSMTLKWRFSNGVIDFSTEGVKDALRSQLRNFLGSRHPIDAHHIIPLGVTTHPVIQAAALDGFHPNMPYTILGLEHYDANAQTGTHQNHPAYDSYLFALLERFQRQIPDYSPSQANHHLQTFIIPNLKTHIMLANSLPNTNLNTYFSSLLNNDGDNL